MDDLKSVFDKIEKAESILDGLDQKRTEKVIKKNDYDQLSQEHKGTIDSARHTIASIKEKLGKDLAAKAVELDKYQEDLAVLQTRLKVGEISEDTFNDKSKHLVDKIRSLEKKVAETQSMINARFAENIAPVLQSETIAANIEAPVEAKPTATLPVENIEKTVKDVQLAVEAKHPVIPAEVDKTVPVKDAQLKVVAEPPATPVEVNREGPVKTEQLEAGEDEEITRQRLIEALKIEPEEPTPAKTDEVTHLNKQEGEAGETGDTEAKKADKGHKPSLHLHPLRDKPPDILHTSMPEHTGKNRFLKIVAAVLVLGLLVWGAIALFVPKSGPNVGDEAPNLVMQLGDNTSDLSAFRGKTVVLVFWDRDFWDNQFFYVNGTLRRLYTPDKLNQLYSKYSRSDLEIIAIASGTSNNEIDKLIREYIVPFPVIVDSFGKLREDYKITYEPTYIFLDKNGIIRARVEGPIGNMADLEQIVYNTSKNSEIKSTKAPVTDVIIQSITEKAATINWTTDKPTSTQVDIDGKNIQSVITPDPQTLHSLILRDLDPATAYHIRIVYNIDNINVSEHSFSALGDTIVSKRYVVNTSNKDTSPPLISNISTGFVTDSSITIVWKTDEPTTGEVDYSLDNKYSESASQVEKLSIWHTVKIDDLQPDTQYNLRLRSKDAGGKETSQEIEPIKTQNLVEIAAKIGKRAPDFSLYSIDGAKFTLNQFLGHKVIVNFWLEGCPACEAEMPILQTAYDKYSRDQLIILAINVRGEPDKVSYYVAKEKLTFPILMDTQGDVDGIYRAPYFPTSYIVDSKGIISAILNERFQTSSQIDDIVNTLD
ncbi:MAG: redoxin domain-containing protein [Chloroflexi bacterium]|nr:redoxin domain-containing protein [Chloroflexota bacterium]